MESMGELSAISDQLSVRGSRTPALGSKRQAASHELRARREKSHPSADNRQKDPARPLSVGPTTRGNATNDRIRGGM
mgnify:CR=1 FL=1